MINLSSCPTQLDSFASSVLADPISKMPASPSHFAQQDGIIDARIFMKGSKDYGVWSAGQIKYEDFTLTELGGSLELFREEIIRDKAIYRHFKLEGSILDVGGGVGTLREFIPASCNYVSVDPYLSAPTKIPSSKFHAYSCLSRPLNFVGGCAEFLPFQNEKFDWVHMRSMLDHVQSPDLALIEARRVLKPGGSLLIGLSVEGGRPGAKKTLEKRLWSLLRAGRELIKPHDHHVWHATYPELVRLVELNGFTFEESWWQPMGRVVDEDTVVYLRATK